MIGNPYAITPNATATIDRIEHEGENSTAIVTVRTDGLTMTIKANYAYFFESCDAGDRVKQTLIDHCWVNNVDAMRDTPDMAAALDCLIDGTAGDGFESAIIELWNNANPVQNVT